MIFKVGKILHYINILMLSLKIKQQHQTAAVCTWTLWDECAINSVSDPEGFMNNVKFPVQTWVSSLPLKA